MSSDGINSEQLLWAIQNGDLVVLRDAVTSKQIDANHQIKNRPMAVIAADYGQLEILKYLHENAVDFNVPDKHGVTPLLAAIFEKHANCVEFLVASGATCNRKTFDGQSYMDVAETDEIKSILLRTGLFT